MPKGRNGLGPELFFPTFPFFCFCWATFLNLRTNVLEPTTIHLMNDWCTGVAGVWKCGGTPHANNYWTCPVCRPLKKTAKKGTGIIVTQPALGFVVLHC